MARQRKRSPFYASRRVPHAITPLHARLKLAPLLPQVVGVAAAHLVTSSSLLPENLRNVTQEKAARYGDQVTAKAQRLFFDDPGLDTLLIRGITRFSAGIATLGRTWLRASIALGADRDGRAKALLPLIPTRGYDALMTFALSAGTAVGLFKGGQVHLDLCYDSARHGEPYVPFESERPRPQFHRYDAPRRISDMVADIDDLYWSAGYGQSIKITRVGTGLARRWLVSLPGTDHVDLESTPNPCDGESNIREVLGLPSASRVGTVMALHAAMDMEEIPISDRSKEQVVICGHSQGGMVAVALAALPPTEAGVRVTGVLTVGAPGRRFRIRPDVTMLAIAHDQDVVPSMDGTSTRVPDHRVVVGRRLIRPRRDPLYYAHSSTTYTQTTMLLERQVAVAPFGRVARALHRLEENLPNEGEDTRVFFFNFWQEVLDTTSADTWETFIRLDRSQALTAVDADGEPRTARNGTAPSPTPRRER
ncbi:hypothetical protein [Schaalia suimastitidis]|uniref:hypothetical protein n=1 Tax=Schaalia suimastitidis TaxID=121163 RepID=UPI000414384E|nr:hypothetical protein [Schaalia suimastitidis]